MLRWRPANSTARVLAVSAIAALALVVATPPVSAQTTVSLSDPSTEVVYATIRGGTYSDTNYSKLLATRSSDDLQNRRRALLKFDTQNEIPAGSVVSSAHLTLTVKSGGTDSTRSIAVYQVRTSWTETEVTWHNRRSASRWITSGGDLGTKLDQETVSNAAGAKVTFDITPLVKQAVAGQLGSSRYTRVALVDMDSSSSASYREYHTPNDSTSSLRPVLKVTYTKPTSSTSTSASSPAPSTSTSTLRVLQWNTHHGGVGTDGRLDAQRLIKKAASFRPDIVSLNEVERYTGWGNYDGPAVLAGLMKQYTGQRWYYKFSTGSGASTGNGNLVMSRFPFEATGVRLLSHDRVAVDVVIHVNGRNVNFTSTHLDADSTSIRLTEIGELTSWQKTLAEPRVIAGDFNAWPGSSENSKMKTLYYDSWAEAQADGTASAYSGNSAGNTRNSRIDYIYYSHGAAQLVLKSSQVYDVRDSSGVMPSDHRPVMSIFTVR
jgi:endonuclease/exonuclease/phosphatase family metal-dependent hydrolase